MSALPYTESFLPGPTTNAPVTLYVRTYAPPAPTTAPKAALVFVHGFLEHVGRFTAPHARWAAAGVAVFAFDQRGFGRSALEADGKPRKGKDVGPYGHAGDAEQVRDVVWALEQAAERWPGVPLFLMGHSMGGGIVLAALTRASTQPLLAPRLRGAIASSPCIALAHPPNAIVRRAGGLAAKVLPHMPVNAPVDGAALSHDRAVGEAFKADPMVQAKVTVGIVDAMLSRAEELSGRKSVSWPSTLPLLVVHGDADEVCAIGGTRAFFDKVKAAAPAPADAALSVYAGGFHELHNEPDGVSEKFTDECVAWVLQRAGAPASPVSERTRL